MTPDQAADAALRWHGEAGGSILPVLTANELASIVNEAIAKERDKDDRWMAQAHCMCSDLGVPPGHIEDRMFAALGRVYALLDAKQLLSDCAPHVFSAAGAEHLLDGFRPQRRPLDDLADRVRTALELG